MAPSAFVGGVGDDDDGRSELLITIFGRRYHSLYRNGGAGEGSRRSELVDLVKRQSVELTKVPVWPISSGPRGDEATAKVEDPWQLAELMELTGAAGHQMFFGKIDRADLGRASAPL